MYTFKFKILIFVIIHIILNLPFKSQGQTYDVEINYYNQSEVSTQYANNNEIGKLPLPIYFENGFLNDKIEILVDGKLVKADTITTDNSTSLARDILLSDYRQIMNVGIRVNDGKLVYVETNKKLYFIGVRYEQRRKIRVLFYDSPPQYY